MKTYKNICYFAYWGCARAESWGRY